MTSVCIVEDDPAVAASLEAMLASWNFETQVFRTGEEFLEGRHHADCVLLDVRLPGADGLTILERWRKTDATTPVVIMTGHGDVSMAVQALQAGAQDFVEKPFDAEELVSRMKSAISQNSEAGKCERAIARLTPRELDVLKQVVAGHPNKVIAYHLGISQKTVELHRARVMDKTGAQSLSHLVRIALKANLEFDAPLA